MSLDGISIMNDATGLSVTGGSAATFSSDGLEVKNGIHVSDDTETDLTIVPHATFKNKPHALQSDGTWSKGRRDINLTQPLLLASDKISYQVARVQMELHPEWSEAEVKEFRYRLAQFIIDSETDAFWYKGTVK
jgi:hypothetical protein